MRLAHRIASFAATSALALAIAAPAFAQTANWPTQPIKWYLPVAAGGAADGTARIVAEKLTKSLGQPIILDHRPGASATLAIDLMVRSKPDGHTFGLAMTPFTAGPSLMSKLPYDPVKDVLPVAFLASTRTSWSVFKDVPFKTLDDLVKKAKTDPGSIAYGTGGVGQASHFAGVLLEQAAGIRLTHAPYKGAAPAVKDAIAGHIPVIVATTTTAGPHVESGRLRMLAVTASTRSTLFPNVPTAREAGFADVDSNEWFGLIAPAGTPDAIIQSMNKAIIEAIRQPDVVAKFNQMDLATEPMTPAAFGAYLDRDMKNIARIVKAAGIKPE